MIGGLLVALVVLGVPAALLVLGVRAWTRRHQGEGGPVHGARQFFQYLLLLGLLIVTFVGVTGLLGLVLQRRTLVDTGGELARGLTFTLVGGGLLVAVAGWTRGLHRADPREAASLGWLGYLTLAGLVTGVLTAVQVGRLVATAATDGRFDVAVALAGVVWAVPWAAHGWLAARTLDAAGRLPLLLLGSLSGWAAGVVGLAGLLSQALVRLLPQSGLLVEQGGGAIGTAGALLAGGALLWVPYWALGLRRAAPGPWWLGYVLVLGVGASLVTTLSGASVAVYRALVGLVGDASGATAVDVLRSGTTPFAVALVGALSWWYHRQVFDARTPGGRTEVTRVHEYLVAAVALAAAATGVALVVVALVDAVAPAPGELVTGSVVNSVLAALTLLAVGGPLWWVYWRSIERALAANPAAEVASPSRRVYLVLLFGVMGVVAVVVVLVSAFLLINDVLRGTVGAGTVRDARVPLGILVATGAVSGYHWAVQRQDRAVAPAPGVRGPRRVLLVGPLDDALVALVHRSTGARVESWLADGAAWDAQAVLQALALTDLPYVLLVSDPQALRVVQARSVLDRPTAHAPGSAVSSAPSTAGPAGSTSPTPAGTIDGPAPD